MKIEKAAGSDKEKSAKFSKVKRAGHIDMTSQQSLQSKKGWPDRDNPEKLEKFKKGWPHRDEKPAKLAKL